MNPRSIRSPLVSALLAIAALAATGAANASAAAPAACSAAGGGKYNCDFYLAGDGQSSGTPVNGPDGGLVGYLHKGTNWVICQRVGNRVTSGVYYNDNWAYTLADNNQPGWVNAVYASGGDNDGPFGGGVPPCGTKHGSPPGAASAAPPPAPKPPPRKAPSVRAEADKIMRMTYDQFADFSRLHLKPFDWSTDGCSGPKFTKRIYKDLFDKPCRLHDFGYRNYGRGLHLGRNETTRAWIDLRFKQEMDRRCNHFTGWQSYKGVVCRSEAHLIYDYERKTGNLPGVKGFYG